MRDPRLNDDLLIGDRGPVDGDWGAPDFSDSVIAFFCSHARGGRVLDLGCVNHNPESYKSRFWVHKALCSVAERCVGLDLYAEGVAYLVERGFDVRVGDAANFDLGESFDLIVAGELIEHLGNPGGMLDCVRRHLAPGGTVLLSTPNPWYWRFVARAVLSSDVRPNPEHVAWYCRATLGTLLERHGFVLAEFGRASRYRRDLWMPLPAGLRHTTLLVAARPESEAP